MNSQIISVVRILLTWFLCLFSVLLHELGHALGYRLSTGKAGWKIIAGSGPDMIRTANYTFRIIPAGGYFIPEEDVKTDKEAIMMYAGGPLVSLLQAILFYILYSCIPALIQPENSLCELLLSVSAFLLYFNFFQFLFTVIPIRYRVVCRGFESDGLQIVHALKNKKR